MCKKKQDLKLKTNQVMKDARQNPENFAFFGNLFEGARDFHDIWGPKLFCLEELSVCSSPRSLGPTDFFSQDSSTTMEDDQDEEDSGSSIAALFMES